MRDSGNGSPEVITGIAEREMRVEDPFRDQQSRAATVRRIRNGLEALLALPYYLLLCSIIRPERAARFLEHLFEYQRAEKVHSGNHELIPTVDPQSLFPGLFHQRVSLLALGSRPSGTTFLETYLMVSLLKFQRARTIFEFGTSEGRTTLQFALNASEAASIYTLDLPDGASTTKFNRACPKEASTRKLPIGGLFHHHPESVKINQLLQDSATVDFEPFRGKMDFIFIDGDHSLSYVKSDSENAFSMLSPCGVILWHDYGGRWPDVARYLQQVSVRKNLYHLQGTSLVVYLSDIKSVSSQLLQDRRRDPG